MDCHGKVSIPLEPYDFEFKNVSFKYPNSDKYIYKNLNIKIQAGQKLAIVGHNGAGKTTFVKLLCRLYDVTDGEILLNGINIKKFNKNEYYTLFSTVFQDVKNLAFSVAENVALTEEKQLCLEKVQNALEQAGVYEKVSSLKKGMSTAMQKIMDDEGIEFSGGENQKVSIARALYKNGPIMVLDEPTAALDALAENEVYLKFNKIVQNKTAIYVSHRLASTHFCDKIAMFEQGKLIEYGTHDELIKLGKKYFDMFSIQAKYYKEERV
jgi:ATP-binding cassette subfamily C protein